MVIKNKKLLVRIIICFVVLFLGGIGFWVNRNEDDDKYSECVTKQEWIGMLGEHTGAVNYVNKQAYFSDVDEGNEYYAYIQSAVEWGFIEAGEKFDGEKYASGKFVVCSAIKSIGVPKIQLYLGTDKDLTDEDYLDIALDLSLIEKDQLKKGLTKEEAHSIIENLDKIYYGEFWPKDLEEVEYQDNVIILNSNSIIEYDSTTNTLKTSTSLQKDDVISFKDGKFVVIRKILKVFEDGFYELGMPEMEEAFKSLRQSGVSELSFQDIVNYYGEDNLEIARAIGEKQPSVVMVSHTISGEVDTKGFKIEAEEDSKKLKIYVTDNDTGVRYKLPVSPKISDDYKNFSAALDVKKIFVGSQIDYSVLSGVNYADVAIDVETEVKVGLSTEDEISDRIILFETPAPIGTGLIGIDIQIYLVTTLKGDIYMEAELPYQADVYYEKDKGVRNIKHDFSVKDPIIEASAEMKKKIDFAPILVVGEFAPIIDAELGAGIVNKVSVTVHDNNQICTDAVAVFPVVDVSVGQPDVLYYGKESLIAKLGWSGSWDIISVENAPKRIAAHFEILPNKTKQFIEECTYGKEVETEVSDDVLNELLNGDFSQFVGSYKARESDNNGYGGGKPLANLELYENGSVSGGGSWYNENLYPTSEPKSISKNEDGSYLCVITDENDGVQNKYYIYPEGVADENIGNDSFLIDTVYIRFVQLDGGVLDIVYYKDDEADSSDFSNMPNTYLTKDSATPIFSFNYPDGWSVEKEELGTDYEWDILKNERGVKINYYSLSMGFGSQYYEGNRVLDYAHITKVADSSFVANSYNGKDYSLLGNYVVAKIQVYAYDDGMTEEGEIEYDGATYYAVIPDSYLGNNGFCGTGYWSVCSFEYVRPMVVLAEAPEGKFTSEEETEVIQILSSFSGN